MAYAPTRLSKAFALAADLHEQQVRKSTEIPYVTHVMAVAALVGEAGGDEDEVIAALLHDGPEDQGGEATLALIRERFGARVAEIVADCSDTFERPKPPWQARKEAYIAHLRTASASAHLVSCADKLHNARSIVADRQAVGEAVWDRFSASRDQTLWYYRTMLRVYRSAGHAPARLVDGLARAIDAMVA